MPIAFSTMTPEILNTGNTVSFSLPILNAGSAPATNVFITDIHLGSAARLAPAHFPVFAGTLGVSNIIFANAKFRGDGLTGAHTYLITVAGTYQVASLTYTFEVYRVIRIPAPTTLPVNLLQAHIDVTIDSGQWSYTVVNEELHGSSQFINAVSLDIVAAATVTGTPPGWQAVSDSMSYVLWYAVDERAPYPTHIAPGSSRAGFAIRSVRRGSESTGFALTAWNHQTDAAGIVTFGAVSSPSREI
jgi:hypothetical protein